MPEFIKVCKKSEIPEGTGKLVKAKGKDIALFKFKGKVCALYAHCPHQGGPLDEGGLADDGMVTCPWHGWEFHVETGQCGFNPGLKQPIFPVKEDGDDVSIEV